MKKKILFGLLGLVVAMFTMTACSNDDDDNNGGVASGLKLTSIERVGNGGEWEEKITNTYDKQGRIIKYFRHDEKGTVTYTYDYQDNTIKITEYDDDVEGTTTKYTLENGLITKGVVTNDEGEVVGNSNFSYDKDRQLVSIVGNEGNYYVYEETIVWKDGNIESYIHKYGSSQSSGSSIQCTCKYISESAVKGLVVDLDGIDLGNFDDQDYMLFKLGYFGKQPKNLLASIHKKEGTSESDDIYTYGFEGKDGYVSSRTKNSGKWGSTYVDKYTWE